MDVAAYHATINHLLVQTIRVCLSDDICLWCSASPVAVLPRLHRGMDDNLLGELPADLLANTPQMEAM